MERKTKTNRASARNPYDTYLSWWFKYARNNEMYFDDTKQTSARPLGYTEFQRRYDQMRRANIQNPARMVAMESREATEYQLRKTWEIVKDKMDKASDNDLDAYAKNLKRLIGKEKITYADLRKNYRAVFKTYMPYEYGDNPFLVDEHGQQKLTEHYERDEAFGSPKERKIKIAA